MSQELKPQRSSHELESDAHSNAHHGGNHHFNFNGQGGSVSRFITPGGNPIDNSQPAFPGEY